MSESTATSQEALVKLKRRSFLTVELEETFYLKVPKTDREEAKDYEKKAVSFLEGFKGNREYHEIENELSVKEVKTVFKKIKDVEIK